LKYTLESSPFEMEVLALKQVEKTSARDEKKLALKLSKNLDQNSPKQPLL